MNNNDLEQLYKEFIESKQVLAPEEFHVTPKQQAYLLALHQQGSLSNQEPLQSFGQLLKKDITDWSQLTKSQVNYLIIRLLPELIPSKYNHGSTLYQDNLLKPRTRVAFKTRDIILESTADYQYGYQIKSPTWNLYFLRFYQLAMLDYDNMTLEQVETKLSRFTDRMTFRIYETFNGFRGFIVSESLHYRKRRVHNLMKTLDVDPWYIIFAQHHGFKVRLNPKPNRQEQFVAKFVKTIGTVPIDPYCQNLVDLHDDMVE